MSIPELATQLKAKLPQLRYPAHIILAVDTALEQLLQHAKSAGDLQVQLTPSLSEVHAASSVSTLSTATTAATAAPDPELALSGSGFGAKGSDLQAEVDYQREQAKKYKASGKPLLWDFDDLLEYAEGNIAPVFNKHLSGEHPPWALIDTYDKCCRLPMREYLLCSRSPQHNQTAAPANLRQGRCMAGLLLLLSVPCSRI